jgi:hypothetical protein
MKPRTHEELCTMHACAARELGMRNAVYPRWIDSGKMTAKKAAEEIAAMEGIVELLDEMKRETDPQQELF